jgi:site-specific recombinase XerD
MLSLDTKHTTVQLLSGLIRQEIDFYLIDCESRGLSKYTIINYREELKPVLLFLESISVYQVVDIKPEHLRECFVSIAKRRNPGGINSIYRALRAFLNWWNLETETKDWKNPLTRIKPPKIHNEPIKGASLEDIKKMVSSCEEDQFGKRDKVLLLTLLDTAARASEFCQIKVKDLDIKTGNILLRICKNGKSRMVFVGKKSLRELIRYLRIANLKSEDPLFPNDRGEHLTRSGLYQLLKRRANKVGVPVPSPHDFRRACALSLLRNSIDPVSVSRILGHSDLRITLLYLAQVSDDLERAMKKGSPVDSM